MTNWQDADPAFISPVFDKFGRWKYRAKFWKGCDLIWRRSWNAPVTLPPHVLFRGDASTGPTNWKRTGEPFS